LCAGTLVRVIIRRAMPVDLAAINAVHQACRRREWDAPIAEDSDCRFVAVAVVDDVIVAAAKTHLQTEPDAGAPAGHYLGGVSVHPNHRRRGVGLALTRARIDWVWARSDTVYYFTDDDNTASMGLHAGFGFEEIARLPTILGARANRESLVLFRAVRPADFQT
jgi:ribosomal protein S18 acetylase RimI-like enzyme